MSQLFDKIKVATNKRTTFDLSHHQVTTSDFGYLIPICVRDMVPNDDFTVKPSVFCRLAPMYSPTYGRITCSIHHFFVPYRILYGKWDAFITQDSSNHTVPPYFLVATLRSALKTDPQYYVSEPASTLPRGTFGRLMSNLGLSPQSFMMDSNALAADDRVSAFPFLAYYRIWMDWFMDSNVYDHSSMVEQFNSVIEDGGSLAAATWLLYTRNRCFKKDYFTTAKVSPQDGDPAKVAVDIADASLNPGLTATGAGSGKGLNINSSGFVFRTDSSTSGRTSAIGQFTVEALRAANSLQRYMERNNFVGSKVINRMLAHFGISPTPERLDMAEFLGGSSFPIQIGDVTSTTMDHDSPSSTYGLGRQAGKGVGSGSGESVSYHAKEHGVFMSLMSILPDTGYFQGVPRMFQKGVFGDALDYFHPEFENLGYQEILNKEVYVPHDIAAGLYSNYDPDGVFGYTPRYSEYKFQNDILGGDFVGISNLTDPMASPESSFHLFRQLYYTNAYPLALNENFVECDNHNQSFDRIFQITNNQFDHFYFNIDCDVKATRPMSGFGEPSIESANSGEGNTIELPYGGTRL